MLLLPSLPMHPDGAFGDVHHRYIERVLEGILGIHSIVILTKHHEGQQRPKTEGAQMQKSKDPALCQRV